MSTRRSCGKVRYPTGSRARRAIAHIRQYSHGGILPARAYPCPQCHGWHLTKQAS